MEDTLTADITRFRFKAQRRIAGGARCAATLTGHHSFKGMRCGCAPAPGSTRCVWHGGAGLREQARMFKKMPQFRKMPLKLIMEYLKGRAEKD